MLHLIFPAIIYITIETIFTCSDILFDNIVGSSTTWDRSTMHPKFDPTWVRTHDTYKRNKQYSFGRVFKQAILGLISSIAAENVLNSPQRRWDRNNNNNNNLFILSAKIYNNLWHWKFSILGEFHIKSFMRRWE